MSDQLAPLPPEEWVRQTKKALEMLKAANNQHDAAINKLIRVQFSMLKAMGLTSKAEVGE